jgi:DNA-directed RNA polymerase II subunit RPB1
VIVQYAYGEDRMNGSSVESQELKILQTTGASVLPKDGAAAAAADSLRFMTYADVLAKYGWRDDERWDDFLDAETAKALKGNKADVKELNQWCDDVREDQKIMLFNTWNRTVQESVLYPVNLAYLITQTASNFAIDRNARTDLSPLYVARTCNEVLLEAGRIDVRTGERTYNRVFGALMHYWCSPRRIVKDLRFTRKAWDYLIESIRLRHADALVPPGEMVGVIAAQSIGEPSTQMLRCLF